MYISNIFRQKKARSFQYEPTYYNEQKEIREKRRKEMNAESFVSDQNGGLIQRGTFRSHLLTSRKDKQKSNFRIVIILVILVTIAYFVLNGLTPFNG